MDNYLMLDGEKYELSPELVNALLSCVEPEPEKKSPFERVEFNTTYHYISYDGTVRLDYEKNTRTDDSIFSVANYCTDESLMKQRAMHETLNRLLWRYSVEHGGDKPWNGPNNHWVVIAECGDVQKIGLAHFNSCNVFGVTYFCDKDAALSAVEEIVKPFLDAHPDFVW